MGNGQPDRHVGIMAARVHQPRVLGNKAASSRHVVGFRAFGHWNTVDVKTNGQCGTGASRIENRYTTSQFLHLFKKSLTDAVFACTFNTGLDDLHVTAQTVIRIDNLAAKQNFVAVSAQCIHDESGRCEFRPPFLRVLMKLAADADELIMVARHEIAPS